MRKLKLEELNRLGLDAYKKSQKHEITVVLDNLRSALNVGSVFRIVDSFACKKIYLTGITARPPHKEINKTAIGAQDSVEWEYRESIEDLVLELKKSGQLILAVEQTDHSISLEKFEHKGGEMVLIFGNEVDGISNSILNHVDGCIEVPQFGTKHSLNVSVCVGIVIWQLITKLKFEIE